MQKNIAKGLIAFLMICIMATCVHSFDKSLPSKTYAATYQVYERNLYENGTRVYYFNGWKKIGKKIYYFEKGRAIKGWHYLKSYGGGTERYRYYFRSDGSLLTDFFAVNRKKWIRHKIGITVNMTTHTVTFLGWDNKTNSYRIPLKACVCALPRKRNGCPTGTFRLEKTSAKRWYVYDSGNAYYYYQWAVHIKGTPSLFHSCRYLKKSNRRLATGLYNKLGNNITTHCIRMQAANAKLVYDISTKTNKKARVIVKIFRANGGCPFGKVKLNDTTGKINTRYDPTDPGL